MKLNIISIACGALLAAGAWSCSGGSMDPEPDIEAGKTAMSFSFSLPSQSRATDTSFENGDAVGLYISKTDKPLEIAGNTINNERLVYDDLLWNSSRPLYWDAGQYNIYAYYPYIQEINSITDLSFEVSTNQEQTTSAGMSGYEASDFLFGMARNMSATSRTVNLQFSHIMSKLTIRLVKGEDFEGEIPEKATVYIHNTVTEATIDLSAGVATKAPRGERKTLVARQTGPTTYTAIIVPQRLDNRVPLIEVVMNGVSFLYESKFQFKPGVHHLVSLVVDKNPEQVKIEIGGEIAGWN